MSAFFLGGGGNESKRINIIIEVHWDDVGMSDK